MWDCSPSILIRLLLRKGVLNWFGSVFFPDMFETQNDGFISDYFSNYLTCSIAPPTPRKKKYIGEVIRKCVQLSVKPSAETARRSGRFAGSLWWQPFGDSKKQDDVTETKSYSHTLTEEAQQRNHIFSTTSCSLLSRKKSLLCLCAHVTLYRLKV